MDDKTTSEIYKWKQQSFFMQYPDNIANLIPQRNRETIAYTTLANKTVQIIILNFNHAWWLQLQL